MCTVCNGVSLQKSLCSSEVHSQFFFSCEMWGFQAVSETLTGYDLVGQHSANSGRVTCYRAELTGAAICLAPFRPLISLAWTETFNNTTLASRDMNFFAVLLNCQLKASEERTSRNCIVIERRISQPRSDLELQIFVALDVKSWRQKWRTFTQQITCVGNVCD